jgi:hypothetical protein
MRVRKAPKTVDSGASFGHNAWIKQTGSKQPLPTSLLCTSLEALHADYQGHSWPFPAEGGISTV